MLVMGGTRTNHRLACAIEDTGFIIKDTIMWLYGSGFPKAQDLGKMIDKRACMKQLVENLGRKPTKKEFEEAWEKFREVVGKYKPPQDCPKNKWTDKNALYNKKTNHEIGFGGSDPENLNITIPSTDLAKHWDGFKVGGIKPAYESIIWATKTLTDKDYFGIMVHKIKELLCHIQKLNTTKEEKTNAEKKIQHGINQPGTEERVVSSAKHSAGLTR